MSSHFQHNASSASLLMSIAVEKTETPQSCLGYTSNSVCASSCCSTHVDRSLPFNSLFPLLMLCGLKSNFELSASDFRRTDNVFNDLAEYRCQLSCCDKQLGESMLNEGMSVWLTVSVNNLLLPSPLRLVLWKSGSRKRSVQPQNNSPLKHVTPLPSHRQLTTKASGFNCLSTVPPTGLLESIIFIVLVLEEHFQPTSQQQTVLVVFLSSISENLPKFKAMVFGATISLGSIKISKISVRPCLNAVHSP